MTLKKKNKLLSIVVSFTLLVTQLPKVTFADTSDNIIYSNDFENSVLPNEVFGHSDLTTTSIENIESKKAMKFPVAFDGTDNWSNNEYAFTFYSNEITKKITKNSVVQYDLLIPTAEKNFQGIIKYTAGIKAGDWSWNGSSTYGDLTASSFTDLGNGYSKATVEASFTNEINGVKAVVVQLSAYQCNYVGDLYLDNLKFIEKVEVQAPQLPTVSDILWNFDDSTKGLDGWSYGGSWDYHGTEVVEYNSEKGAIKLGVDYSNDVASSWSEFKIQNNLSAPLNFKGYNLLTFDFIYSASAKTKGAFQTKVFITDKVNNYSLINLDNSEDIGNGLLKAKATVELPTAETDINSIIIGIIGSSTDYKGYIFIDNIKLSQKVAADVYVNITEVPTSTPTVIDVASLTTDSNVKLVDSNATESTADLYSYLMGVGKTDKVIFGHQNDTHHKVGTVTGSTNSDTKDLTSSIAGVVGIDTLSFTGSELSLEDRPETDYVTASANVSIAAANEGSVITLSSHMPNFQVVKDKGVDSNGNYDYSGYTPGTTTGNIVQRIMPGGDLNEIYTGYLNMIADYGLQLQDAGVPVLFRPFHENNGSWFWWGKAFCDEAAYKNLYKYTVEYLRDLKGVHNFLYVYSPNGPFNDAADYLSRYPGDEFVDVIAFDMYHDAPVVDDNWITSFKETIDLVEYIASSKGKLSTVAETGMRILTSLEDGKNYYGVAKAGNKRLDWYNEVLATVSDSNMPYFMVWANFNEDNFYIPYKVSDNRGHEMSNYFIDFYNDERSVFANGVGDYSALSTSTDEAYSYGFITAPSSGSRILVPVTLKASIKNYTGNVNFVLKNNEGKVVGTLSAVKDNGEYSADIKKTLLDSIGETVGTIELVVNNVVLNKINVLFNMEEKEAPVNLVDDFESYLGENVLLGQKWATNAGAGCSVAPQLSTDSLNGGKYGLAFKYKISTEKTTEGWAGITTSKAADWSAYDALQLWIKPDGYGQKLVVQVTAGGEDFEMWLPELAATTEAKLITIPFTDLKGKNGGTFDPSKVERFGLWCNTIVPEEHSGAWTVDSTMYFDDIKAVNTKAVDEPTEVNVTGISLDHEKATLKIGEKVTLTATINPTDATNKNIQWMSSNEAVATVDNNGVVTAVVEGNAAITIKTEDGGYTATCNVDVKKINEDSVIVKPNDDNSNNGNSNNNNSNNNGNSNSNNSNSNNSNTDNNSNDSNTDNNSNDSNTDNNSNDSNTDINSNSTNKLPETGGTDTLVLLVLGIIITLFGASFTIKKRKK